MRPIFFLATTLWFAVLSGIAMAEPLKIGDTKLDHRVLTRPGAVLFDQPGGTAKSKPPVFSSYYVFEKSDVDDVTWLRVGAKRAGTDTFWLNADRSVDWKQTIVVSFTNPAGRLPSLFFDGKEALTSFLKDEAMSTRAELLVTGIRGGSGAGDSKVLSVEPEEFVAMTEQFYLLPILEHADIRVNRRPKVILKVASINQNEPPEQEEAPRGPFNVGIVFVIDTSTSMQPYIDATRGAIESLLSGILDAESEADFSFGLVGFRSDIGQVPGLEYRSKEYFPLKPEFDKNAFMSALRGMKVTTVSSHDFDEDGMSGLTMAAESGAWGDFAGKYIIYISDAGMLIGTENGAGSDSTPQLLGTRLSKDLGIATMAMFLKTRPGRAYHDDSIAQLEQLTYQERARKSYVFPIEDGDVNEFAEQVSIVTEALLNQVNTQVSASSANAPDPCEEDPDSIACAVSELGHAMELEWLGRQNQTQAPDTYEAWVADFALDDPRRIALAPRVLLTRAQLNDVYVTLQAVVEAFSVNEQEDPSKFFEVLSTVMARIVRDPSTIKKLPGTSGVGVAEVEEFDNLGQLLGDYLGGLPYESDLTQITPAEWVDIGGSGRYEQIETIKAKLSMYELYYADTDNWIALSPEADEPEKVYPIPLEMIP